MWAQGYATLRLDSFTARGYHNVCADGAQVRPGERAQDVLAAAYLLAARPDVRPDRIAILGFRTAAGLQFMSPEITRSYVPGGNGSRRGAASSWRVSLFMAAAAQTPAIRS